MDPLTRRTFLAAAALAPLSLRCAVNTPAVQQLSTSLTTRADGTVWRTFTGTAAPQDLELVDGATGGMSRVHQLFPRGNCPFAIDTRRELGAAGYGLSVPEGAAHAPRVEDRPWALNMIPFGVAIDGVIMDPSGPWYDGGPADPENAFDRACSGWEYDPIFPSVAALVGVPLELRGHVQPGPGGRPGSAGLFHYHGVPRVMLAHLAAHRTGPVDTALVVGYSADGFPVLDAVVEAPATADGRRLHLFSGYRLRQGSRTAVPHTNPDLVPPGLHDGTFVQDWEYGPEAKAADIAAALSSIGSYHGLSAAELDAGTASFRILDERNGLATAGLTLPHAAVYAYVLTPDWPEIPRWFAREPSPSFRDIIPLVSRGGGPPGRDQLYLACDEALHDVHRWAGRPPY